jgi:hypothetical protein
MGCIPSRWSVDTGRDGDYIVRGDVHPDATWRLGMRKLAVIGFVIAALAVVPVAVANSSTVLDGYGSNAAKPVVQVKGTTGSNAPQSSGAATSGPSTLPFTGSDLAVFMAAGIVLVGIGVGLRRLGRDQS